MGSRGRDGCFRRNVIPLAALGWMVAAAASVRADEVRVQIQKITHVPSSVTGCALNDKGWAVWATGQSVGSQVYLWDGTKITKLGFDSRNNRYPQINNNNWVVWSALRDASDFSVTDIYVWKGSGNPVDLSALEDTADQPTINDKNQIAWWGSTGGMDVADVFYWKPGDARGTDLTVWDDEGASSGPQLNDAGLISWERSTEVNPGGETNLVYAKVSDPSSYTQLTDRSDLNLINGGLSHRGKFVWSEYTDAKSRYDIWAYDMYRDKAPRNLTTKLNGSSFSPVVAKNGTVAWYTVALRGFYASIYWDMGSGAQRIPIPLSVTRNTKLYPIALNSNNGMLFAIGEGTNTGFDIYYAQIWPGHVK